MRLRARLVLIVATAAMVPIAVLGFGAARLASQELEARVDSGLGRDAEGLALYTGTWLDAQVDLLGLQVTSMPVASLPDDAQTRFLQLVYQQTAAAGLVTLTDQEGRDYAPPVRLEGATAADANRPSVDQDRLERFRAELPHEALARRPAEVPAGPVLGRPYRPQPGAAPVVPVLVPIPGSRLALGVELGLEPVGARIAEFSSSGPDAGLLGPKGASFLAGPQDLVAPDAVAPLLRTTSVAVHYRHRGNDIRAATAPVPGTDWTVVVAVRAAEGAAAVRGIQAQTAFLAFIAAALALGMGGVWAGQLAAPVLRLRDAALAVARGELGRQVEPRGGGELAELGRTFNDMSARLQRDAAEIAKKNHEIELFNAELQSRVEQRTQELRETQERLLQSARLAAVGEMGAGLAHELNNPLAGILGLVQLLRQRAGGGPSAGMLESLEREARRCTDIVSSLLGFSQELPGPGAAALDGAGVVELGTVVGEVLSLVGPALRQRGIEVSHSIVPGLRVAAARPELGRALAQLLTSVRAAAHGSGALGLDAHAVDGQVVLSIELVGPDLQLGGDDWRAAGLGLWAARKAIGAQGGRLVEPQEPTAQVLTWRVVLPGAEA
ncbi:MAG: histidine kinase dimerization/phospho-acceptor domain-containing protein [Myxococcota bacterium]|nr:histidine kinase dimerization/phospho-acceptor domain-containing protein [Myxococcota bacterium]